MNKKIPAVLLSISIFTSPVFATANSVAAGTASGSTAKSGVKLIPPAVATFYTIGIYRGTPSPAPKNTKEKIMLGPGQQALEHFIPTIKTNVPSEQISPTGTTTPDEDAGLIGLAPEANESAVKTPAKATLASIAAESAEAAAQKFDASSLEGRTIVLVRPGDALDHMLNLAKNGGMQVLVVDKNSPPEAAPAALVELARSAHFIEWAGDDTAAMAKSIIERTALLGMSPAIAVLTAQHPDKALEIAGHLWGVAGVVIRAVTALAAPAGTEVEVQRGLDPTKIAAPTNTKMDLAASLTQGQVIPASIDSDFSHYLGKALVTLVLTSRDLNAIIAGFKTLLRTVSPKLAAPGSLAIAAKAATEQVVVAESATTEVAVVPAERPSPEPKTATAAPAPAQVSTAAPVASGPSLLKNPVAWFKAWNTARKAAAAEAASRKKKQKDAFEASKNAAAKAADQAAAASKSKPKG